MAESSNSEQPGILVIEDEALVARDIQSRLRQLGHKVAGVAHTPQQAIASAEETQPGLLLCDIHLKDKIDGIEVARTITEKLDIPVIFLTAYSDRETVARAKSIAPYGYVLKPIETPDLQIAIEMALHKFGIEQELRETKQLLATALQCIGDSLVFVDTEGAISTMNSEALALFGFNQDEARGLDCLQLLQERAGIAKSSTGVAWDRLLQATAVTRLPPFQVSRADGSQFLVDGVVGPTRGRDDSNGVVLILRQLAEISDPIENLPVPSELPDAFDNLYDYPQDHERAFVLLLISPDDQDELLRNLPEQTRESLIRELGEQLNLAMRSTDLASYYGGAVFSASLPYTTLEEANSIASAILQRLAEHWFLQETLTLTVSIGISHHRAVAGAENESPLELFRRANRALTLAQQSGGNRVAIWRPSTDIGLIGNLDSQSGFLTADAGQDYRNMALLWNTMSTAVRSSGIGETASGLVSRIRRSFNLEQVAFFRQNGEQLELLASDPAENEQAALPSNYQDLVDQTFRSGEPGSDESAYCIPMTLGDGSRAALCLRSGLLAEMRQQDLQLVQSLFSYVAGAPGSRQPSAEPEVRAPEPESELLYQSNTMAEVMELIRLVAPTDETVLITGESGTGKEVIAREIHRLSKRSTAPFVIVDCGAVVSSLIERELFGHVKGAFTGAVSDSPGKLKEADGGTLLLDEIGELPLDVQVKLLRVVQDKQFTAVGSTQVETTNTRIIAATNVDLEQQIKQGKFREDLFYRLNVFNVHSPPLRSRDGDIIHLARHFLRSCSAQYGRHIEGFTPAAEEIMQHYPWPGNIRELHNKLIRAVILCQGDRVDANELDLRRESDNPALKQPRTDGQTHQAGAENDTDSVAELEASLRGALANQVRHCLEREQLLPLGDWLEQDLIYAALEQHGQVNLQAAEALGVPESTLRRKLARYQREKQDRPEELHNQWQPVVALLPNWIRIAQRERFSPTQHLHNLLLSQISEQARTQTEAATLVGVSPPTYRRQLAQLEEW